MRKFLLVCVVAACSGDGGGPSFSDQHPRIYLQQNKDRLAAQLAADGPAAHKLKDIVDRWVGGEDVYGFFAWNAALVGQLTGDPKYCTAAVAAVDKKVAAEESTIASGGMPEVASGDYYPAGDDIGDLALVYDWCYDAVPGDRRQAWLAYANQAVSNIWNPDGATWGGKAMPWTGWAIDNPENNYYYNFLRATALLGLAAHGEYQGIDALAQFHDTELVGQLVPKFDADLVGGGSREGTGYGISLRRLWELYDLWKASTGEDLATKTKHTRASMLYFIHETLPTLDRVAPTGDQSRDSTASFFDYHRNFLQELVTLFHDDPLAPRVQALLRDCSIPEMTEPFMYGYDFLYANDSVAPTTLDGLGTAFYGAGTGQLYARSGWDKHATWINLNAGPYTESHAHQDQGALMIYKDGWLAYDPVVDSHSGLPQDVDAHGTLRVVANGSTVKQKTGFASTMLALHRGTGYLHAAADLAPVYDGAVAKLQREIIYIEPDTVVIYDRASTSGQQVWQLAFPKQPTINGMTTTVQNAGHTLTVQRVSEASATASIHDYSSDSDFITGFRLDETAAAGDHAWLHVAYVDGAVTQVTPVDANTVDLVVGGKNVHVAFNPTSVGGTLMLGSTSVTLGAGVDSLPE